MEIKEITYDDKVDLYDRPVPEVNKIVDDNMNEIKDVSKNHKEHIEALYRVSNGSGIPYATLVDAMAVDPLPADGTPFQIYGEGSGVDGQYIYDSGEAGGYLSVNEWLKKTSDTGDTSGAVAVMEAVTINTGEKADLTTTDKSSIVGGVNEVKSDFTTLDGRTSNVDNTSDANKPISDATQTALNGLGSNISDVDDKVDANEDVLKKGSGAYTHAKEVSLLTGGKTIDIIELDAFMNENSLASSAFKAGFSIATGKLPSFVPDVSSADYNVTRATTEDYVDKYGNTQTAPINTPVFDWSLGYAVMKVNGDIINASEFSIDPNTMLWKLSVAALSDDLTDRRIGMFDGTNSYINFAYASTSKRMRIEIVNGGATFGTLTYENSNTTLMSDVWLRIENTVATMYVNGVIVATLKDVPTLPTMTRQMYDYGNATSLFKGLVKENTKTSQVALADSKFTNWEQITADLTTKNYSKI